MYTLGTAGHVDHGKSSLVEALTGINPDRWEEEQRRQMTIDLGFARLTLPSGRAISLVDVPGHERFIKNMLAGVGGLDAVLLIIAADEGIQPQTVEHLHIIDLLGLERGLVVLTKRDLVDDEWLELMAEEVRDHLRTSVLAAAPLVPVSARSGAGLAELKAAIDQLLDATPARTHQAGVPRLPVDRAFTIGGFGTVVTGTLLDGPLAVGDEVEVQPGGARGRIRGLQTHQIKQDSARPGTRVAVNLSGISRDQVGRGTLISRPGAVQPTTLLDINLRLVASAARLEQNDPVDLFVGAAETAGHITLLDRDSLEPGGSGWVQVRLEQPIAAGRGDRCIVRRPSPSQTIGGGVIIDPHPARHRRFRPAVISALETLARGTPAELLAQILAAGLPLPWGSVLERSGLDRAAALAALEEGRNNASLLIVSSDTGPVQPTSSVISAAGWSQLKATISAVLGEYHTRWPLRPGMPREELRSRLKLDARSFNDILARANAEGWALSSGPTLRQPGHEPQPDASQQRVADELLARFRSAPATPPARDVLEAVDPEVLAWLLERGVLIRISAEVVFLGETYASMRQWIEQRLSADAPLTLAEFRDAWQTSRKYAQAFLEHLDERRVTRRNGDTRVAW